MQVGFKTDKGVQRSNNEDACFVLPAQNAYVVADGVGGGNAGEIASRTAVTEFAKFFKKIGNMTFESKYDVVNFLSECFSKVNNSVYELSSKYKENTGMATTLVAVYCREGKAYIGNVGDSRVYLYRDDDIFQLTEDHTYLNVLVRAGVMSKEEAENDDRKNVIVKALGAEKTVEPDFFQVEMEKNDCFIICTDGLYGEVNKDEIIGIIRNAENMSELCSTLVARANTNGGKDNITVVALKVTEEDL